MKKILGIAGVIIAIFSVWRLSKPPATVYNYFFELEPLTSTEFKVICAAVYTNGVFEEIEDFSVCQENDAIQGQPVRDILKDCEMVTETQGSCNEPHWMLESMIELNTGTQNK